MYVTIPEVTYSITTQTEPFKLSSVTHLPEGSSYKVLNWSLTECSLPGQSVALL